MLASSTYHIPSAHVCYSKENQINSANLNIHIHNFHNCCVHITNYCIVQRQDKSGSSMKG
jgi:hypothetical protein